jgi:hypothetical protein
MPFASLRTPALRVLTGSDTGSYTQPLGWATPYQENWPSAIAALGFAEQDPSRAYTELESLLNAANAQGMVPSIAYDESSKGVVPGPSTWGYLKGGDGRYISGLTHSPMVAICLKLLYEQHPDNNRTLILVEKLHAWHQFLLTERTYEGGLEPVLIHPSESMRPSAPEWDKLLQGGTASLDLLAVGRGAHWNQFQLAQTGGFRVLDAGFSSLLAASCLDVAELAALLGQTTLSAESEMLAYSISQAVQERARADGMTTAFDCVHEKNIDILSAGTALTVLLPGLPTAQVLRMRKLLLEGALSSPYGVATLPASHEKAAHDGIWRGAVSPILTWLCALGLSRHGENGAAGLLRQRMFAGAELAGMHEFGDAATGLGLGNDSSAATAACLLWSLR